MLSEFHLLILGPDKELQNSVEGQVSLNVTTLSGFEDLLERLSLEVDRKGMVDFLLLDCRFLKGDLELVASTLKNSQYCSNLKTIGLFNKRSDGIGMRYFDLRIDLVELQTMFEKILKEKVSTLAAESRVEVSSPVAPVEAQPKILVVEDNLINQKVAKMMLKTLGYSCVVVNNGREACDLLKETSFEMILMDCQMPVMDGFQATNEIRNVLYPNKHVPIVAFTANVSAGNKQRCYDSGMDGFIAKPIDRHVLESEVEKWMYSEAR